MMGVFIQRLARPKSPSASLSLKRTIMPSQSYDWFVQLPDKEGALQQRIENRPLHLAHNKDLFGTKVTFGGPTYSSPASSLEDGMTKINGSVHVIKASSEGEVWDIIRDDPYAKLGIWDLDKTLITPMKCFVMQPL